MGIKFPALGRAKEAAPFYFISLRNDFAEFTQESRIITDKYGKETDQQSVSAAMKRLGIKPEDK